jgi:hypothetical protein
VARDAGSRHVVHHERVAVSATHDWTARTRVKGLEPAEEHRYRFVTRDAHSPAGRFRTAHPADSHERVHDTRQPESGAFTPAAFRVEHGRPAVIDAAARSRSHSRRRLARSRRDR